VSFKTGNVHAKYMIITGEPMMKYPFSSQEWGYGDGSKPFKAHDLYFFGDK
jgi:hypothetical protein